MTPAVWRGTFAGYDDLQGVEVHRSDATHLVRLDAARGWLVHVRLDGQARITAPIFPVPGDGTMQTVGIRIEAIAEVSLLDADGVTLDTLPARTVSVASAYVDRRAATVDPGWTALTDWRHGSTTLTLVLGQNQTGAAEYSIDLCTAVRLLAEASSEFAEGTLINAYCRPAGVVAVEIEPAGYTSPDGYLPGQTIPGAGWTYPEGSTTDPTDPPPPELTVTLTASPGTGLTPLAATLTASASGGTAPYSHTITFGDGQSADQQDGATVAFPHTYAAEGYYTATVTVTDANGATASAAVQVIATGELDSPTNIVWSYLDDDLFTVVTGGTIPTGRAVTFGVDLTDAPGTGTYSYTYDFGNGNTYSGTVSGEPANATGVTTYSVAGTYTVSITVTDTATGASVSGTAEVTVADDGGGDDDLGNCVTAIEIIDSSTAQGVTIDGGSVYWFRVVVGFDVSTQITWFGYTGGSATIKRYAGTCPGLSLEDTGTNSLSWVPAASETIWFSVESESGTQTGDVAVNFT